MACVGLYARSFVFSRFFLVSLARHLSLVLTFSKNQFFWFIDFLYYFPVHNFIDLFSNFMYLFCLFRQTSIALVLCIKCYKLISKHWFHYTSHILVASIFISTQLKYFHISLETVMHNLLELYCLMYRYLDDFPALFQMSISNLLPLLSEGILCIVSNLYMC